MDATALVAKIESRFTLEDVQNNQVETISVVALDELDSLIQQAVSEKTSELELEVQQLKEQLANVEGNSEDGGGGLEAAAAEAAMEAEARALEAAAEAEQRAAEAETQKRDLEAKVAELQAEADKIAGLQAEVDKLKKELEGGEGDDDDSPVTDDDLRKARRLATAFLEDVFSDDEDKTNAAIKDGKFREVFAKEIKSAHRKYVKRIRAAVRAEGDFWEDALKEGESQNW